MTPLLRKLLGLESVKDAEGNVIQEAALSLWATLAKTSAVAGSMASNAAPARAQTRSPLINIRPSTVVDSTPLA